MDNYEIRFRSAAISVLAAMNLTSVFSPEGTVAYLRTLPAIRERCGRVFELAQQGKLEYFDYHPEKEADVAMFCTEIIQVR